MLINILKKNFMNILFTFGIGSGFGDELGLTPYIKDLKQQYKDINLFFSNNSIVNKILQNNPFIKQHHNEHIDQTINHRWQNFGIPSYQFIKSNEFNFLQIVYHVYNDKLKLNVKQNTTYIDVYLTEKEKEKFLNTNKKICVVSTAHALYGAKQIKYWGTKKYQELVNNIKDEYDIVQVGSNNFHTNISLQNISLNLVNKTNIRKLFQVMYNADLIITGVTGLYHAAHINSFKSRKIICIGGSRQTQHYTNCYTLNNTKTYWLGYDYKKYQQCFKSNEICCWCDGGSANDCNQKRGNLCKKLIHEPQYNDYLADCINSITVDQVLDIIHNK